MRSWEHNIRKVIPYVPGEQPEGSGIIKLNTNENPYPPAPEVEKIIGTMDCDQLRKYPDPTATLLVTALADYHQVGADQVFVGVGSDDVLAMAFLTFFNSPKPIIFPEITYSFYPVWADLFRVPYQTAKIDQEFRISIEDFYRENGGILFPNPNAPTGVALELDEIEEIVRRNQNTIVIIDEAYIDFGGVSALELLKRYENLLIVRTFSKSRSMAGIRIGYAIGHPVLIKALNDVKYSYNSYTMNLPALLAGAAAVTNEKYFKMNINSIIETREMAKLQLKELGFVFPDSRANFIFASHPRVSAEQIYQSLCKERIYVRYFKQPRLDRHLRISIGTKDEMRMLYEALRRVM